jgi:hypothetical protein
MARGNDDSATVLQTPVEGAAGVHLSVEERMRAVLFLIAASELFAEHSMPSLWLDEMEQVRGHTASARHGAHHGCVVPPHPPPHSLTHSLTHSLSLSLSLTPTLYRR